LFFFVLGGDVRVARLSARLPPHFWIAQLIRARSQQKKMAFLGRAAAELSGTADICAVVKPGDFPAAPSVQYLLTEDGEVPMFILRSKQDEYCFSNRALVHLDGNSAMSKKRLVVRYPLSTAEFSGVMLETAGTVDLDVEIKFTLGGRGFSLDVDRRELQALTALYKALVAIADIQARGNRAFELSKLALDRAAGALGKGAAGGGPAAPGAVGAALVEAAEAASGWLQHAYTVNNPSDFGPVFARYLARAF
jgi:hypothetical protein